MKKFYKKKKIDKVIGQRRQKPSLSYPITMPNYEKVFIGQRRQNYLP